MQSARMQGESAAGVPEPAMGGRAASGGRQRIQHAAARLPAAVQGCSRRCIVHLHACISPFEVVGSVRFCFVGATSCMQLQPPACRVLLMRTTSLRVKWLAIMTTSIARRAGAQSHTAHQEAAPASRRSPSKQHHCSHGESRHFGQRRVCPANVMQVCHA